MSASDNVVPHSSRFWRIAGAGIAFQAGAVAIDSASLVFQLNGSAFAVCLASVVLRLGWLLPQLGAYGRAIMAAMITLLLWFGGGAGAR